MARGFRLIGLAALTAGALAAGAVLAQTKGPFGGFKHDSKAQIEIAADSLEVRQAENLAIFAGEVVAGQGTLRLTADKLEVNYASGESGGAADAGTGKIHKMRAEGNVFLSNGEETAKGAWAEYNVSEGMIHMGGDVVLTQGGNAISSQSLVINLNDGTGRVQGGRVKSVFTPSSGN
jgi:lipopolysaccharide export system protein LptA